MVDGVQIGVCACAFVCMHVPECVHLCADILNSTLLDTV